MNPSSARSSNSAADPRWQAVTQRDRSRVDFVYAVRTTGIYCRSGCASRKPRRENVEFFDSSALAERAGYRACRRCHPQDDRTASGEASNPMVAIARHIEAHAAEPLPLATLARVAGSSPAHLQRRFTACYGLSPARYHAACRKRELELQLRSGPSVTRAILASGYGSASRVYERADELLGMTPRQFKHGGRNVDITWACLETQLGTIMLGATDRGLCFLSLGDDAEALLRELRARFPEAVVTPAPARTGPPLDNWRRCLNEYIDGLRRDLPLPLDVQGTAFQTLVWQFLQHIPHGQTRSYSEVAAAIGRPSAVRAVASACARNDVSLVIPCHRVLRSDGSLGGYRWGIERKRRLLDLEQRLTPPKK